MFRSWLEDFFDRVRSWKLRDENLMIEKRISSNIENGRWEVRPRYDDTFSFNIEEYLFVSEAGVRLRVDDDGIWALHPIRFRLRDEQAGPVWTALMKVFEREGISDSMKYAKDLTLMVLAGQFPYILNLKCGSWREFCGIRDWVRENCDGEFKFGDGEIPNRLTVCLASEDDAVRLKLRFVNQMVQSEN